MSHLDEDTIALIALGEEIDGTGEHLSTCDVCRTEIDAFAEVVTIARSTVAADTLVPPPDAVWAGIAAETGLDPGLLADVRSAPAATAPQVDELSRRRTDKVERSSPRRTGFLVAASVAGLLLGVGGTLVWQTVSDEADVVATADLAPLPAKAGTGEAEVVDTSAGRELEITLETDAPDDAFLQVWLLSPDATRMVPVGVIAGKEGHWTLPPDVTLADFPVVDVSVEPYDGVPTHSGDSVVRGTLDLSTSASALD